LNLNNSPPRLLRRTPVAGAVSVNAELPCSQSIYNILPGGMEGRQKAAEESHQYSEYQRRNNYRGGKRNGGSTTAI
jgi:hypothetical protein